VEIASWSIVALQKLQCYKWMMNNQSPARLTDEELIVDLKAAASRERAATAELIALLAEMDARHLYLEEGYSSLFVYCTKCLRLSEHAAYGRIEAARAVRKFPIVLELLTDGSITLTTVCLLASHLTVENCQQLLTVARHKTKREVEEQIAALAPKPQVPSVVRKLPQSKTKRDAPTAVDTPMPFGGSASTSAQTQTTNVTSAVQTLTTNVATQQARPIPAAVVAPLTPERYKVQITISRDTHYKLRKAQDLLRHVVRNGDPAVIFDRALTLLVQHLESRKMARVDRPRNEPPSKSRGRHVPAAVKRQVWERDEGQCAFIGTDGRCSERGFLEIHHVIPFADGGPATVDNLQLRCRAHNAYEARQHFGPMLLRECTAVYGLGPGPS
jgi:hypothetical protein